MREQNTQAYPHVQVVFLQMLSFTNKKGVQKGVQSNRRIYMLRSPPYFTQTRPMEWNIENGLPQTQQVLSSWVMIAPNQSTKASPKKGVPNRSPSKRWDELWPTSTKGTHTSVMGPFTCDPLCQALPVKSNRRRITIMLFFIRKKWPSCHDILIRQWPMGLPSHVVETKHQ